MSIISTSGNISSASINRINFGERKAELLKENSTIAVKISFITLLSSKFFV